MVTEGARRSCEWTRLLFRVVVSVEAVLAFGQAVLAGGFLEGHYPFLDLHKENATITGVCAIVMTVVAVLQWRVGGGPAWPVFVSAGLFGAEALQIVLGYARLLDVHIPLGVAIISGIVLLTVRVWWPVRQPEPAA